MMIRRTGSGRLLYARWEIRAFRGIERFSDYKRIKDRMRPVTDNAADVHALQRGVRSLRLLLSDRELTTITAVGTVMLVVLTAAPLIVTLL